ncbi:hypothetical protein BGZ80_000347 [Entomortierella chlamydospora]|uniref:Uncharacterized protein n=1 Tax=Entomortierella chlamydospora TaxID=101097 RepID=A0A9P6N3L0_9FUNG|nr:hypothetical protein BGZ79_007980 [Entomortierella chlamydospora]KAG0022389.1 hypothetical protein BGZ80_000347 [Entomortierella chlamydospora]
MVSESTRKTLILSVSAIVGITTVSTLAYLLIQDDRRAKHHRKIRTLQKSLTHKLSKVETSIQELIDDDIRLAQVRARTLRTYPIYPGDPYVKSAIIEEDKIDLSEAIEETQEELTRERAQGYGDDSQKVRQGYKRLDFLIASVNERLLRQLEALDAISPRELTDLGNGSGGVVLASGPEVQAFEKVRKRKKAIIEKAQKLMAQMDKVSASFKDRLTAVEIYEKKEAEAAAAAKEEEEEKSEATTNSDNQHTNGEKTEPVRVKEGLSFAAVAKQNIPKPEVLEPTADLEKMKEGVTFAEVATANTQHENSDSSSTSTTTTSTTSITTTTTSTTRSIISNGSIGPLETEHLEGVTDGVSFADVASKHLDETEATEAKAEILEPTEDLERMKDGVTFAEVAAPPTAEVLKPTEDLEKMKDGLTFAEVAAPPTAEVLKPTEDLERMKDGLTFADVAATPATEEEQEEKEEKKEEEKPSAVVEGVSFAEVAAAH